MVRVIALALLLVYTLSAQDRVLKEFACQHVWAVVPIIGIGKAGDLKRDMFVPSRGHQEESGTRSSHEVSADWLNCVG
jgi:hypothetical protein